MEFDERRKFHRISFDGKASLQFTDTSYECFQVKDLSLTGMFVKGKFKQHRLRNCLIRIYHKEKAGNNSVRALGKLVWSNDEGVGLRFTAMTFEDYMILQTTLINKAEQPEIILREFPEVCPFEISNTYPM